MCLGESSRQVCEWEWERGVGTSPLQLQLQLQYISLLIKGHTHTL